MVEVEDEVEDDSGAPQWQATVGRPPAAGNEWPEAPPPRQLRVSREIHPRHRRLFRPA
jgi:hypothetical protein